MSRAVNTTTAINATDVNEGLKPDAFYSKALLTMIRQTTYKHRSFAEVKALPRNYGDTINFRRYNKLAPATTPLTEGVTPDGSTASGSSITATLAQYGDVMFFTDVVADEQLDDVKAEYTVELGYQAQETLDVVAREKMYTEASKDYAGGAVSIAGMADSSTYRPTLDLFRKVALNMKVNHRQPNRKAGNRYAVLIGSAGMYDLLDDEKLEKKYMLTGNTNQPITSNIIVDIYDLHFVEVLNPKILEGGAESNIEVQVAFVIGQEAYAETMLEGRNVQIITKGLGSAGTEDALNQRSSIGWKVMGYAVKVLDALAIHAVHFVPSNKFGTGEFPRLSVAASNASAAELLGGKSAADLQSNIVVGENYITGTSKYVTGYTQFSGDPEEQSGNYIVLKITSDKDDDIYIEVLGKGLGVKKLDEDGLLIIRITDPSQILRVTSGGSVRIFTFDKLTLETAE